MVVTVAQVGKWVKCIAYVRSEHSTYDGKRDQALLQVSVMDPSARFDMAEFVSTSDAIRGRYVELRHLFQIRMHHCVVQRWVFQLAQ
jgi:exosome complex RNA-binding protein Csl4